MVAPCVFSSLTLPLIRSRAFAARQHRDRHRTNAARVFGVLYAVDDFCGMP
jgi:hypothetical protein